MHRREALKLGVLATGAAILPSAAAFAVENAGAQKEGSSFPAGIHVNQVGYLPGAAKVASVANAPAGAPQAFRVVNVAGGAEVFRGVLTIATTDEASGDSVALADFSAVNTPGTYLIEAAGLVSDPFTIAPDVYKRALYLSARAFYGQRCGCEVDLGDGYKHPACHKDGAYHPTSGRAGKSKHHGGWHDAGDYGRYVVNSGISTATLMYAFEMYPQVMAELRLDIPKHHKHLPDILAEVRWNLDWMISLQDAEHGGDGGVWHKQTSEQFCAFIMPQADTLTSYIIGSGHTPFKTTAATADLAATAAIAARVFRPFDRHYADHCLKVARAAWLWAVNNPDQAFTNPPVIGTGGYGDEHLADEVLWASAELYRTTGEPQFEAQFLAELGDAGSLQKMGAAGWGNLFTLGCFAYAQSKPGADDPKEMRSLIHASFSNAAQGLVKRLQTSGYGNTMTMTDYGWGSNSEAGNQSFLLLMADQLKADPALREAALSNLHYLLGRNCHGISWVTHLGARPFQHPHHRPSVADGIAEPWPGLVSGGPNRHPADEAAKTLPDLPPMRMWLDDDRAYSLNEVAINWNAPLVLLLAAANAGDG